MLVFIALCITHLSKQAKSTLSRVSTLLGSLSSLGLEVSQYHMVWVQGFQLVPSFITIVCTFAFQLPGITEFSTNETMGHSGDRWVGDCVRCMQIGI